jgi:hypothetical protein
VASNDTSCLLLSLKVTSTCTTTAPSDIWYVRASFLKLLVTCCGRICIYKKKINLSTSLAGQTVGIKEVDDGIWLVRFMNYDFGYIDLEEKTLQPLHNPFGPKV